jgi:hypothetical protein
MFGLGLAAALMAGCADEGTIINSNPLASLPAKAPAAFVMGENLPVDRVDLSQIEDAAADRLMKTGLFISMAAGERLRPVYALHPELPTLLNAAALAPVSQWVGGSNFTTICEDLDVNSVVVVDVLKLGPSNSSGWTTCVARMRWFSKDGGILLRQAACQADVDIDYYKPLTQSNKKAVTKAVDQMLDALINSLPIAAPGS